MSSRRSRRGLTKRPHPWPPVDARILPQLFRGSWTKAVFARDVATCLPPQNEGFYVPFSATAEEWRFLGFTYLGKP